VATTTASLATATGQTSTCLRGWTRALWVSQDRHGCRRSFSPRGGVGGGRVHLEMWTRRLPGPQRRAGQAGAGTAKIVFVAAGGLHTVALAEGGVLWVWGFGDYSQLGLGYRDSRLVPTRLGAGEVFGGSLVRMAACGGDHTLVVMEEGVVWAFGGGEHGRLGLNDEGDRLVPTRVDPLRFAGAQVATVAAGTERNGGRRPLHLGQG